MKPVYRFREAIFYCVHALICENYVKMCVYSSHMLKASVKLVTFDKENQIIPWQGVYFFTDTVLQKS